MGVPTFKYKLWAFVIGAGIGGLSGAVYAGQVQYVDPRRSRSSTRCCSCVRWSSAVRKQARRYRRRVHHRVRAGAGAGIEVGGRSPARRLQYLFFGLALVTLMIFRPQGLFSRLAPG